MAGDPDFWLSVHDTFWHDLPVDAVACTIIDGPRRMFEHTSREQWLVQVEPPVSDDGLTTSRLLVDYHPSAVRLRLEGWELAGTGVCTLRPSVRPDQRSFGWDDLITTHKMTVTSWAPKD